MKSVCKPIALMLLPLGLATATAEAGVVRRPGQPATPEASQPAAAPGASAAPAAAGAAPSATGTTTTAPAATPAADAAPAALPPGRSTYELTGEAPTSSPNTKPATFDRNKFSPDPVYVQEAYDPKAQYDIYGGKRAIDKVRPLVEFGQPLYTEGPLNATHDIIGAKNLVSPQFYLYGDWRLAAANNDNGAGKRGLTATRLNLDADLKLTATERVHALFRPLEGNGEITSYQFSGQPEELDNHGVKHFDMQADTFFFEGDLGAITAGLKDEYVSWDLPFAVGIVPLVYQNGIWMDDAFVGGAASVMNARNSKLLNISNYDVVVFGGSQKVSSKAIADAYGVAGIDQARIYGVTTFLDVAEGYLEAGYGYTEDKLKLNGADFSYHNVTMAFSKRYFSKLSNSVRLVVNTGQNPGDGFTRTADGHLLLIENSWITSLPSTLIPYFNVFVGKGNPQSLARDAGAGGILKNTGLSYETDGLTGFPKLTDTGNDSFGGAVGVEYLFGLNRQLIVEVAGEKSTADVPVVPKEQYAFSTRYQQPLDQAWIFRADGIVTAREDASRLLGTRIELRRKF